MSRIRVLVIEDSATVRGWLVSLLDGAPDVEVVGAARDGREGLDACRRLRPDVVTLDLVLPGLNGVEVTEQIMAWCPTPILVVSGSFNRGELFRTYDALAAGALECVDKPRAQESEAEWAGRFLSAVRMVSRVGVITHLRGRRTRAPAAAQVEPPAGEIAAVAIGASTGGPQALRTLLGALPADFPVPILLVVHVDPPFGEALAEWLDRQGPLRVRCAEDGEPLPREGVVRMAPAGRHLALRDGHLRLVDGPPLHACRPAVDVLFRSVALELGSRAAGCLLTGMGRDGAEGLEALRRAGAFTLAQDEGTSVVFGMPREAIRRGAAARVLPIGEMAPALATLARRG